jgi:flavodoxin
LLLVCGVLLAVLIGLVTIVLIVENSGKRTDLGDSTNSEASGNDIGYVGDIMELVVQSVEEQGDVLVVKTTYGTIQYPAAFSDLIRIETETFEKDAQMVFSAFVGEEEVKLYTLYFNRAVGIPLGTLTVDGVKYAVTAEIHDLVYANEDNRLTYQAAQETFNDVAMSLEENENFQAAQ